MPLSWFSFVFPLLLVLGVDWQSVSAEPIPVLQRQGAMHGFLVLRSGDRKIIAAGDEVNVVEGNQIHSRLVLRFRDGSIEDERAVFRQGKVFELVSDHHVQKGPSFPQPLDMTVDVPTGKVTWRQVKDGRSEVKTEDMDLPSDLANGMMALVVQNFPPAKAEMKVSYLVAAAKPRLIKLSVKPDGEDVCRIGGVSRRAERFKVHVEFGGIAGVVAPLVGKEPPDIELWALKEEFPAFLKMRGPLFLNGPTWELELSSPVWSEEK